jgi:hypothetical protein
MSTQKSSKIAAAFGNKQYLSHGLSEENLDREFNRIPMII